MHTIYQLYIYVIKALNHQRLLQSMHQQESTCTVHMTALLNTNHRI